MSPTATPTPSFLTLRDVTLRRRDQRIFRDTRWELRRGEQWAVLGPNGSGKSTLMRALWGATPIVEGEIVHHYLGSDPLGRRRPEEAIAYVSFELQSEVSGDLRPYYQARWNSDTDDGILSVEEFLLQESRGTRRHRRGVRQVGRLLGVGPILGRKLLHLSNGELRKTLLARAILRDPLLLILDDPFCGLDAQSRRSFARTIEDLMKSGVQLVLVASREEEIPDGITHVLRVEGERVLSGGPWSRTERRRAASSERESRTPRLPPRKRSGSVAEVLVDLRDVSVVYDRTRVLQDIRWTLRRGENWLLVGPNGAGKTTLLSLIAGDNPQAYENDIFLFGVRRGSGESIWDIKRRLGLVSPELQAHQPSRSTCLDVVCSGFFHSTGMYRQCTPNQVRAARSWLRALDAGALAERPYGSLSAGEQRLVLLARAMVSEPPLLVLDEPCQGLDDAHRRRILSIVDAIARRGGTQFIYVTHHADEIPASVTHVLRLREGRVVSRRAHRG